MKILLTGVTGYVGKRLLYQLISNGFSVVCAVRDKSRFSLKLKDIEVIELDLLKPYTLKNIPNDIDGAYYLVHSMVSTINDFEHKEMICAKNFVHGVSKTQVKHVIYLSGIVNDNNLSKHLLSRKSVEDILSSGNFYLTTLRAGIIIGSGSASFEILRDLVEKLPIMITPKWILTKSQPIAIRTVLQYLVKCMFYKEVYDKAFDIAGPDIVTYKEMMLQLANVRNLKRYIVTLPVMTPRLSSYWLYFITSTSYYLATNLVNSMKVEVIAKKNNLQEALQIEPIHYKKAVQLAFMRIAQNEVVSSWKDSMTSSNFDAKLEHFIQVPSNGCYFFRTRRETINIKNTLNKIWKIGGETGWYYANWLWEIRGFIDKVFGGVGLRRGRTHMEYINTGDALDFWRVIVANKDKGRLLLFAEMKLPGEAWLEFNLLGNIVELCATFRPKGLWGRLYWTLVTPFHYFIFKGMIRELAKK